MKSDLSCAFCGPPTRPGTRNLLYDDRTRRVIDTPVSVAKKWNRVYEYVIQDKEIVPYRAIGDTEVQTKWAMGLSHLHNVHERRGETIGLREGTIVISPFQRGTGDIFRSAT